MREDGLSRSDSCPAASCSSESANSISNVGYTVALKIMMALNRSLALYKHMHSANDWDMLHLSWRKIVEEFSRREFTVETDRLPALSDLAKEIISKVNRETGQDYEYLAGLWRKSLDINLTWISEVKGGAEVEYWDEESQQTTFRSPTWSWCNLADESCGRDMIWVQSCNPDAWWEMRTSR
jgi:hypothetical protein